MGTGAFATVPRGARRPNVLLILTDDQGWGDLHSHGNERLDTPVLDRLGSSGVRFDRFFVSPLCSPCRSSLLTGRHHLRSNVLSTTGGLEVLSSDEVTLAEALKPAGYVTGCFGKWHNGLYYPSTANGQGFDEFFGFRGGFFPTYFDPELEHNQQKVRTKGFMSDILTDAAIRFIEANRSRPFFCYLPYNHPHSPLQAPDELFAKYSRRGFAPKEAAIYAMVERLDTNIGRLLARLAALGLAENTIVIYASDNGANSQRYNGGMRGYKGSVHEGGVRVPLFICWPGQLPSGAVVRQIAAHTDLFPTILELSGVPMPRTLPLDGVSLVPLLHGRTSGWPDRMLYTISGRLGPDGQQVPPFPGSVRTQRYRWASERGEEGLYDMVEDPNETVNVAGKLPDVARRLRQAYLDWFQSASPGVYRCSPIAVGYNEANPVELQAQHCHFDGNTKFFGHGWEGDWATNFRTAGDSIHWNLNVVQPGRYQTALTYTCPAQNVGTKFRVEAARAHAEAAVRRAHDPAAIPQPDRVPRWEVPVKQFAELPVGVLELNKGPVQLVVRAPEVPGESKLEVRSVILKRLA
ncbi:MAG: arylsulfatase [Acidobacteria bacterium]|nr:arylsulfatase [Acidobacteriota bacterium]